MEVPIDVEWLKALYDILTIIYSGTDRPIVSGFPIVTDYDEAMLNVCVERGKITVLGKLLYPHTLQQAAFLMHSIINFHPFVDGNKRAALLATNFYLHWNGYKLIIPKDADDFTIDVAMGRFGLNDILVWLRKNTRRTPFTVLRHSFCENEVTLHGRMSAARAFQSLPHILFFPSDALRFFRIKIMEDKIKKAHEIKDGANALSKSPQMT